MKAHRALFPIRAMCRVLGLSPSGYYAWLERPPSARSRRDDELRVLVRRSWQASRRTYGGRPRIHADLKAQGKRTSPKRIARIMREEGIASASRRRGGKAAVVRPDADARPASGRAWLYVAVVVDAWSRLSIRPWSCADQCGQTHHGPSFL